MPDAGTSPAVKKSFSWFRPKQICTVCGTIGRPKRNLAGSDINTLLLFILFIVPGLVYMLWRRIASKKGCRICRASPEYFAPLNSRTGENTAKRLRIETLPAGYFSCKVCDAGVMVRKSVFRMNFPVVAIGYIVLIPSLLAISISVIVLVASVGSLANKTDLENIPTLTGSWAIIFGVSAFVAGLLGWLLIMKKRILQCSKCGATITAS